MPVARFREIFFYAIVRGLTCLLSFTVYLYLLLLSYLLLYLLLLSYLLLSYLLLYLLLLSYLLLSYLLLYLPTTFLPTSLFIYIFLTHFFITLLPFLPTSLFTLLPFFTSNPSYHFLILLLTLLQILTYFLTLPRYLPYFVHFIPLPTSSPYFLFNTLFSVQSTAFSSFGVWFMVNHNTPLDHKCRSSSINLIFGISSDILPIFIHTSSKLH